VWCEAAAVAGDYRIVVDDLLHRSGIAVTDEHRALLYRLVPVALDAARRICADYT
jgi:hypothetical protein